MADSNPLADFLKSLAEQLGGLRGDELAAYNDLSFYSRYVIGHNNPEYHDNSPFIERIYNILQHTSEDALILGPRNSAKSQAVTITYVSWMVGRNPLVRFMLAFASQEMQGLAFVRQLEKIITRNERYIKIFGELKPQKPERWTDQEMIVNRPEPPSGLKDPTVAVVGLGSAVPSKRADQVICDDLVTQGNAYSEVQRASVVKFVYQSLFPILVPGGRRILVGSRWDPRDLYAYTADLWGLNFPEDEGIDFSVLREIIRLESEKIEAMPPLVLQ